MAQPAPKRPLTPLYIFFYLIFWPDTWRIIIGLVAAALIAPNLSGPGASWFQIGMLFIMLAAIGYAATGRIGHLISSRLRQLILNKR